MFEKKNEYHTNPQPLESPYRLGSFLKWVIPKTNELFWDTSIFLPGNAVKDQSPAAKGRLTLAAMESYISMAVSWGTWTGV